MSQNVYPRHRKLVLHGCNPLVSIGRLSRKKSPSVGFCAHLPILRGRYDCFKNYISLVTNISLMRHIMGINMIDFNFTMLRPCSGLSLCISRYWDSGAWGGSFFDCSCRVASSLIRFCSRVTCSVPLWTSSSQSFIFQVFGDPPMRYLLFWYADRLGGPPRPCDLVWGILADWLE